MSLRTLIVIGLALFCGFSASIGVMHFSTPRQSIAVEVDTVPVVVAASEILRGRMITPQMVELRPWPKKYLPQGALTRVEQTNDLVAITVIGAGEPLLESKLGSKKSGLGLAALIPTGMRAYTIKIANVASNVAGFILPGSRVDVLLTLRGANNDESGGGTTVTLLQAVEVLAVDQDMETPDESTKGEEARKSGSVTLLITPDQAPVLDLGQNMGTLTLALRNPADMGESQTQPATLNQLRYLQKGVAAGPGREVASVPSAGDDQEEMLQIRTLRGNSVGRIHIARPK
ncbi:MAG: Flp pilus assembly protein CpaB [Pirellulaceae bacterium]|nr:Flp pilus assembly protein CpaB [Pirellulaceae bacterium]